MSHAGAPTVAGMQAIAATPPEVLEQAIATLRAQAPVWSGTDLAARLTLLEELRATTDEAGRDWTLAGAAGKTPDPDAQAIAEELGSGVLLVLRQLRLLAATLRDIAATGRPQPGDLRVDVRTGRVVVDVLPTGRMDSLLFRGFSAEVRLAEGIGLEHALGRMGRIYRPEHVPEPAVALVLGAGNLSSIGPMDALHQLFGLGRVVLLKMSPVNAHLGPHIGAAFAPLVREGLLRIVYGGDEVGAFLAGHEGIDAVHLTGSKQTHEAIVAAQTAATAKALTSELGSITPIIVVPGPWSDADVAHHGDNLASMLVHNAGFNCVSAGIIVQHRAWSKRRAVLDALRASLRRAPARHPFYPGALDRWRTFTDAYPTAERFGDPAAVLPFTLIPELDPDHDEQPAFTTEPFCGVVGEVALEAPRSIPEFLDAAVDFCNDTLSGTLAASILIHPRSLDDPKVAAAFERTLDRLRYGSVVVNHFPGAAYAAVSSPWGAHPDEEELGSGRGFVHNTYLLEDVEKTVVRGPFRPTVKPPWFHDHRTAPELLERVARMTARDERRGLPALPWNAVRG